MDSAIGWWLRGAGDASPVLRELNPWSLGMLTDRSRGASRMLLRRVLSAAESGTVHDYFAKEQPWEASMRQQFGQLAQRLRRREQCQQDVLAMLRQLNALYGTRFKGENLPLVRDELLNILRTNEWLLADPPSLFEMADGRVDEVARIVPGVLQRTKAGGATRPYSLVTKFLHFCFPTTFAIFDSQAAKSIHMWAVFAFDEDNIAESAFAAKFAVAVLSDTGGSGYQAVLGFYRTLWNAGSPEQRTALGAQAAATEHVLRDQISQTASVTTIDLIDKLLWQAAGNPLRLGLATPPGLVA